MFGPCAAVIQHAPWGSRQPGWASPDIGLGLIRTRTASPANLGQTGSARPWPRTKRRRRTLPGVAPYLIGRNGPRDGAAPDAAPAGGGTAKSPKHVSRPIFD